MARVLLIQPPLWPAELFARGSRSAASLNPPLGLAYVAAYLRKSGHECRIVDGIAEPRPLDAFTKMAGGYDVIGITALSSYAVRVIELMRALKANADCAPVVVGGPHATVLPESLLERGADYAVIGEGEAAMAELVAHLSSGSPPLREIRGLAFFENGACVRTGAREDISPLDEVPLPARDLLPMHLYRTSVARASRQPSHSMLASRGCPGVCSFCDKRTFGSRIRAFSPARIVEEFFLLRDKYGARDVSLWDDNFVTDREVALAVCEELRRRGFDATWSAEARIDAVNRDTLAALRDAGCTFVAYGIESGSQRVLDHINKRLTKEGIRETIRMTKEAGLAIRGYYMFGFPTETLEEMEETLQFALELDVDVATFTLFLPLPGTLEYRRALETGTFPDPEYYLHRILPEFNFPDAASYVPDGMTAEGLLAFHRKAYDRYYLRPSFLFRALASVRSPREFVNMAKGGLTLVRNSFGNQ